MSTVNAPLFESSTSAGPMISGETGLVLSSWAGSLPRVSAGASSAAIRPRKSSWNRTTLSLAFPPLEASRDHLTLFKRERAAFLEMLPILSPDYDGKFVAVHRGALVDSDESRATLIRRFFGKFGDTSVYVGFVGPEEPTAHQVSPFRL